MPLFTWNNSYLLGIKEFDEHHQHLVNLLNMSFDAFENNAPPAKLEPIIEELIDYATYHFAAEEYWMAEYAYPKRTAHTEQHNLFSKKMLEFQKAFIAGKTSLNADLFSFLADWLALHILESDSDYGNYFADLCGAQQSKQELSD